MDYSKLSHDVQHCDIDSFLKQYDLQNCLRLSHKKTGDTVLHLACRWGRKDLLEQFALCDGVDLQIGNYEGKKPLHETAQFSQLDCMDFLLQSGVQVDCLKRADWTPLMLACTKCQLPVISLLLKHGADPALFNKDGWNSFHIAAREGHVDILKTLLASNTGLWNVSSHNGRTPLHTAALHGHREAVRFMLTHCHYVPDTADSCGVTPLMDAVRAGSVSVVQLLINQHQASVSAADSLGRQAVHHAAQAGQHTALHYLLSSCCVCVNASTPGACITPLHIAAKEGQDEVIRLLVDSGADVNMMDSKGRTALHIASGGQHASAVQLLLTSGAQDTPNEQGQLARQLASHPLVKQAFDAHGS